MNAGSPLLQKFTGLGYAMPDANLLPLIFTSGFQFPLQLGGKTGAAKGGNAHDLFRGEDGKQTRNERSGNTQLAGGIDEFEEIRIVVK